MPELHKLTPALGVLQDKGFKVALVTDGRMSGASGKVPAAIHLTPEAADGGAIAKVREGDVIRLDAVAGTLDAHRARRSGPRASPYGPTSRTTTEASAASCSPPSVPRSGGQTRAPHLSATSWRD